MTRDAAAVEDAVAATIYNGLDKITTFYIISIKIFITYNIYVQ